MRKIALLHPPLGPRNSSPLKKINFVAIVPTKIILTVSFLNPA